MVLEQKLLAVLIDADNIPAKYAGKIINEVKSFGDPGLRRVYGDWSSPALASWKKEAVELGIILKQETANTKHKNASDIGLVIDAMDFMHTGRFDGFVLVSSDSDFTALASRLRENGADVIGIGEDKAPDSFRNVCNRFIFIGNIVRENVEKSDSEDATTKPAIKHPIKQPGKLISLIRTAMASIDSEGEWYRLSEIGSYLYRANPDFDTRTHGRSKLSDLVAKLSAFELRKQESHLEIRLKVPSGD